LRLFIE
jgi:hypothetical protein